MNYEKKFYDAGLLIAGLMAILIASAILFTAPASAANKKPNLPPANTFLISGGVYPMIHSNSAATDVTTASAWTGNHVVKPGQVKWLPLPPSNVGAAHYPYPGGEQGDKCQRDGPVKETRHTAVLIGAVDIGPAGHGMRLRKHRV